MECIPRDSIRELVNPSVISRQLLSSGYLNQRSHLQKEARWAPM